MPTQYDMNEDSEIYRAVLEYDRQPMKQVPNPHYQPNYWNNPPSHVDRSKQPWLDTIRVPDGPRVPTEKMIGPYQTLSPIKAYVTRNRDKYNYNNLRIKRVERASAWEEVNV